MGSVFFIKEDNKEENIAFSISFLYLFEIIPQERTEEYSGIETALLRTSENPVPFSSARHVSRSKLEVRRGELYERWAITVGPKMKAPGVHILGSILKIGHSYKFVSSSYSKMNGTTAVGLFARQWRGVPRGGAVQLDGDTAFTCGLTQVGHAVLTHFHF